MEMQPANTDDDSENANEPGNVLLEPEHSHDEDADTHPPVPRKPRNKLYKVSLVALISYCVVGFFLVLGISISVGQQSPSDDNMYPGMFAWLRCACGKNRD